MALHPLNLPPSAALLTEVVQLLETLLRELAQPGLNGDGVNVAWVQAVWNQQDAGWVKQFCGRNQIARIKSIAGAPAAVRQAIYDEFRRQNDFQTVFNAGGNFQDYTGLLGGDAALQENVSQFFKKCYELLAENNDRDWRGYVLTGDRTVSKRTYKEDFCSRRPTIEVCPYCDGNIGTPELDHYLYKDGFPFLACSPQNLFPACHNCNETATAKGDRPAIDLGPPRSMQQWLHPLFRPATANVTIQLAGNPRDSIPQLHSADANEQVRLDNHTNLIRTLGPRWTKRAAATFDVVVREVNRKRNGANTVDALVGVMLDDYNATRGRRSFALVDAAVCRAVLAGRPGYVEEFANSNAPVLV